jgi:hypothetical protein
MNQNSVLTIRKSAFADTRLGGKVGENGSLLRRTLLSSHRTEKAVFLS